MTVPNTKKAFLCILIGVFLLGTSPLFVKYIHANGVLVGFYRLFFAGLMLSLPVWLFRGKQRQSGVQKVNLKWPLLGGLAFALNISLWCSAMNYTTASAVTLLDNTAPVWVGLIGWLVLKEKQSWRFWLGLLITLTGISLMVGWDFDQSSATQLQGNLLGIASGFSYALYIFITRKARKSMDSLRYSWIVSVSGALILFLAAILMGLFKQPLPFESLVMIFLMAFSSQVVAWLLVNYAIGHLPAAGASVALVGQPVVVTVLGVIFLQEIPTLLQLFGGVICLLGIFAAQRSLNSQQAVSVSE